MRVVWLFLLLCVAAAKTGSRQRQKHLQAQVRGSHKANANAEAQIAAAVNALLEETDQLSILVASDAELRSLVKARINNQQRTDAETVATPPLVLRTAVLNTGKGNKGRIFANLQNDFAIVASSTGKEFRTSKSGADAVKACGLFVSTSITKTQYDIGIETVAQDKAMKVVSLLRAGGGFNVNYASYSFGVVTVKCNTFGHKFGLHRSASHLNKKLLDIIGKVIQHDCVNTYMKNNRLEAEDFAPKGEMGRFYTVVGGYHYFLHCSVSKCQWLEKYSLAEVRHVFTTFYAKHEKSKDEAWRKKEVDEALKAAMQSKLDALYEELHAKYKAMPPRIPKQGIIFEKLPGKTTNAEEKNEHQYRFVSGARFYQGGQDFCLDRKYCHWSTSDARLAGCGSCGAVGWSLSRDGKLANDHGRNCLSRKGREANIKHCDAESLSVIWEKVGSKKAQAALVAQGGQEFVPKKRELVLHNPIVKKCQKEPAKWTVPFSAQPIYNGVVLLDTRHDGNGPNPAEELATKLLSMNYQSMTDAARGVPIDGKRWMSGIDDATRVSDLVIPGSHDTLSFCMKQPTDTQCKLNSPAFLKPESATEDNFGVYITQDWSLKEQLERGLRWFDLRLVIANDVLYGSHDGYAMKTSIKVALRQMITFLTENPREFIFATLKVEQGAFTDMTTRASYWKVLYNMAMNELSADQSAVADEARGKIVSPLVTYAVDSAAAKAEVESSVLEGLVNAVRGKLYLVPNDIDGGLKNGLPQNIPDDINGQIKSANEHTRGFKW